MTIQKRLLIGLTGGIGSGKSAAADRFTERGITVVDTDAIAHELTAPGGRAMAAITTQFGPAVTTPEGALDRAAMRARVFADPAERKRLEAILHPLIRQLSDERVAAATSDYVILMVPLLVEAGHYRERFDRIVVVDCSEETQIQRVMARNQLARAEVERILAVQASRAQRLEAADDVVDNNGTLAELQAQVDRLDAAYRRNRGSLPSGS